jgi:hypothetical protein
LINPAYAKVVGYIFCPQTEVHYSNWRSYLLTVPVLLTVCTNAIGVLARPATVFMPHLERIQSNLPEGLVMRLPRDIPLSGHSDIEEDKLVVSIFPSDTPRSFTVSVFTCDRSSHPCLLGSFSVEKTTAASALAELDRHKTTGDRLILVNNVPAYLVEGPAQNPPLPFSTIMWQQNEMIYTISFPAHERESMLWMATSMATEKPLSHR